MYQHFMNEHRADRYQQDCRREAATERALRVNRQHADTEPARLLPPRPALMWLMGAVRHALAGIPMGK